MQLMRLGLGLTPGQSYIVISDMADSFHAFEVSLWTATLMGTESTLSAHFKTLLLCRHYN